MFRLDQVGIIFNCDICNQLLVDPITLICGNTVCQSHIQQLLISDSLIGCTLCQKNHTIPEGGFKINKRIQNGLNIDPYKLRLIPKFFECKQKINEISEQVADIDLIAKAPSVCMNERFGEIKAHVNLRRADLKTEIDNYADELILLIDYNKLNCIKRSEATYQMTKNFDETKKELDELKEKLDTFEINDRLEHIEAIAEDLKNKLSQILGYFKETLNLEENYLFIFQNHPIAKMFGKVIDLKKVIFIPFSISFHLR